MDIKELDQRNNEDNIAKIGDLLSCSSTGNTSCASAMPDKRLSDSIENRSRQLQKQSTGCSISDRPLILSKTGCNSININDMIVSESRVPSVMDFGSVMRKLTLKSTAGTDRKQPIINGECTTTVKNNNHSTALSLNLLSWKESAVSVVESIRERIGTFRKSNSLENSTENVENVAESTATPIKRYRIGGLRNMSTEGKENLQKNQLIDTKATFDISTNKVNIGAALLNSEDKSTGSGNKNITESLVNKPISSSPSCTKFPLCINAVDNEEDQTPKQTLRPFCTPCLGSVESVYDNHQPQTDNNTSHNELSHTNNSEYTTNPVTCDVIVIPDQVAVANECRDDVSTTHTTITANHTKIDLPHNLVTGSSLSTSEETGDTMIQNNNYNNDDNKSSFDSSLHGDEVQISPDEAENNSTIHDNTARNITLWDLRNSLECNEIDIKNARDRQNMQEEDDRRISLNTDCGTEHSPRSTPSSERLISRGILSSESEDDSRFASGNTQESFSPRHDRLLTRSKVKSYSSTNHDENPRDNKELLEVKTSVTESEELNTNKHVNVIVTTAVVQRSPALLCCHAAENVEHESINQSITPLLASDRRRQFSTNKKREEENIVQEDIRLVNCPSNRQEIKSHLRLPITPRHHRKYTEGNTSKTSSKIDTTPPIAMDSQIQKPENAKQSFNKQKSPLRRGESTSSDDVFLSDQKSSNSSDSSSSRSRKLYSRESITRPQNFDDYRNTISPFYGQDQVPIPPYRYYSNQRCKYTTKPESTTSSGASSPTSPYSSSIKIFGRKTKSSRSSKSESNDSLSSHSSSSRGSSGMRSFSRLFRRSHTTKNIERQSPSFCGYTMDRDYCVDSETDRIFKTFLCQETNVSSPSLISTTPSEPFPPPSHMLPPRPLNRLSETQLRRQVMKKQYSDSIAMYYGQRMRKWRFAKQKSDSVNCPVDRATLRRQDRIEEEFDPEEINERLSSSSSSSRKQSTPPTVTELKEWRRASLRTQSQTINSHPTLRQTNSLPRDVTFVRRASIKRVTFQKSEDHSLPTDESPEVSKRTLSG